MVDLYDSPMMLQRHICDNTIALKRNNDLKNHKLIALII